MSPNDPVNPANAIAIPKIAPITCLSTNRISNISYLLISPSLENAFFSKLVLLVINI